jgi:hypothetical protein
MALTVVEEWDRDALQRMLVTVNEPASRHLLCCLMQQLDGPFNTVEYVQKYEGGRYYGSFPCAQNFNSRLRRMYFNGRAVDVDMRNCFCSILEQLASRHELVTPYLQRYNNDPKEIQKDLEVAVGDTSGSGKLYFICMLHGGDLRLSESSDSLSSCYLHAEDIFPFVRGFRVEFEYMFRELSVHYPDILLSAQQLAAEACSANVQGRFFHLLLCVIENDCLMAMKEQVASEGRSLVGLWYDGLMIFHDEEDEEKNPIDLDLYERRILLTTGYSMRLAFKSLEVMPSDVEWLGRSVLQQNEELINNRTYSTSVRVDPFTDFGEGGSGWLLVSAPMGSGKTYQMMKYIKRLFTKSSNTRVLLPTSRIVQTVMYRSLLDQIKVRGNSLPITVYRDSDFLQKAQFGPAVVVIEYESLHLLLRRSDKNPLGECMAFSSVILDETGGLMSTLISPTNAFNLVANYTAFGFIVQKAREVLCMCADMFYTPVVPEFVLGLVPQERVRAIIYTSPTVTRTYTLYPENVSLVDWQERMWESIRVRLNDSDAPRIALLTRTKIAVDSFLRMATDKFEEEKDIGDRFIVVTRDTSQSDMELFSDMEALFSGKLGIVASPKITSATDIQHVHSVFMDVRGIDGASVRSIGQASGRVRNAFEDNLHVMIPYYKPAPLPPEPTKEECRMIVERRESTRINTMSAFKYEIESQERIVPGYEEFGTATVLCIREPTDPNLVNLVANITRESKLSGRSFFVSQFQSWIVMKGFKLAFAEKESDGPSEEALQLHAEAKLALKEAKAAVKEAHAQMEERVFTELRTECTSLGDIDRALSQMRTAQAADSGLSAEQSVRLMMLSALAKYPSYFASLTLEQARFTMKHGSVLYAATVCNLLRPDQIRDLDVANASRAPLLAEAGLIGDTIRFATDLIKLGGGVGFEHTDNFPIDIDVYLQAANLVRMRALVAGAKDSLKGIGSSAMRKSRATKTNRAMVKGELRSILNRIGVKLDPECSRGCTKYRVMPNDSVAELLPHISFRSLDPDSDSGVETVQALLQREKEYTRLLDAVQSSTLSSRFCLQQNNKNKNKKKRKRGT